MKDFYLRTAMLLGEPAVEKLKNSKVLVVGLGGVGSYSVEALARAGVGSITLCDHDKVSASNVNRQLCALNSTIDHFKTEVIAKRLLDINPQCKIKAFTTFFDENTADIILEGGFDYIIDAIDSVDAKVHLIKTAFDLSIPIISALGTGNKLDPTKFEITTIDKTSVCPLARVMRRKLKDIGIKKHLVLFSKEQPIKPLPLETNNGRPVPGSISFVPSCAGLTLAGYVIRTLVQE